MGTDEDLKHEQRILYRQSKDNAAVRIEVDADELVARASFYPPTGEGLPLTPDLIQSELDTARIVYGVQWEQIQEAMVACNLNRKLVRDVVIAQGDKPSDEIPEHFVLEEGLEKPAGLPDLSAAQFDYHTLSPFVMVNKDAVIARRVAAKRGVSGKNVYGAELAFAHKTVVDVKAGKNTAVEGDRIIALASGRLILTEGVAAVEEILVIKGDVDYHTGNVSFPGDIVIEGTVQEGFKVIAGGSLFCKGALDATEVQVKKDLTVTSGIIGRKNGTVRVGGSLTAKFIQTCRVAVRAAIRVQANLLNSDIYTLDSIDLGDKGRIIGGEVAAVHHIRACSIGNAIGRATFIRAGTDFTVQQRLNRANERQRLLTIRARKIETILRQNPVPRLAELHARMLADAQTYAEIVAELLPWLDLDEGAVVEVTGDVFPGVTIEICHLSLTVDKPLHKVRFRMDKEHGKVISENL